MVLREAALMANMIVAVIAVVILGLLSAAASPFIPEFNKLIWIMFGFLTILILAAAAMSGR
jgi:hypothetical protein